MVLAGDRRVHEFRVFVAGDMGGSGAVRAIKGREGREGNDFFFEELHSKWMGGMPLV